MLPLRDRGNLYHMKTFTLSGFLLLLGICCAAQYQPVAPHILTPEKNIDDLISNENFWIKHAYDSIQGGFFSNISRTGAVLNSKDASIASKSYYSKSLIAQTRQAYGFTRAFMLTGNERYLTYARSALDFLFKYGWDNTNGGWYTFAKADGTIDNDRWWNPNTGKWGFTQHYALLGVVANYEATRDSTVKYWMDRGTNCLNNKMWDSRSGYEGYYEQANANWSGASGKGFTCTVDAITTHAELAYLTQQDPDAKKKLLDLADIIVTRFMPTMDNSLVVALYPESYSNNWVPTYSGNGSIGHFLKTAWVLQRAYLNDTTRTEYLDAANRILSEAHTFRNSNVAIWDTTNGGPYNSIDIATGAWGTNGDNKDYWTLEQGFMAPMLNYYITKNAESLKMADDAIRFYNAHFNDSIYGETFQELDPTGTVIRNGVKGDDFKANYHAVEFCYYAYLYSNLFYLNQAVTLYYKFAPTSSTRDIVLNPVAVGKAKLCIQSVSVDGNTFTTFDGESRTLQLAANQGGVFKVVFRLSTAKASDVASIAQQNMSIYPNPVADVLNIDGANGNVHISIADIAGTVVLSKSYNATNKLQIDLRNLHTGLYLLRLKTENGNVQQVKLIKR